MIRAPEYICSISPYVPGKPVEELERELGIEGSIKLASNENPLGPSPMAVDAIRGMLGDLHRYPDGSGFYLKEALSKRLDIAAEKIILGNGSNELIEMAVRTFLTPGDEAIMAKPSFVVYSMIVQAVGGTPISVPLQYYRHDLKKMADMITEKTKIVFIANPNNPTGTINNMEEMDAFMDRVPEGILVIVDEAYYEYVTSSDYPDSMQYLRDGKDILILRTFSKIYGLAGLRIGYGICKKEIAEMMNRIRQPFNTNSIAQRAAVMALQDMEHVMRSRRINEDGKRFLYREFTQMGIDYIPTQANFIYIPLKTIDAMEVYERLLRDGMIIRPVGKNEIRVTIGIQKENERFITAFKALFRL